MVKYNVDQESTINFETLQLVQFIAVNNYQPFPTCNNLDNTTPFGTPQFQVIYVYQRHN